MKKVEKKILESKCYNCSGTGQLRPVCDSLGRYSDCPICQGTGKYKETFYYFIDGKKKIAFSGDTLK